MTKIVCSEVNCIHRNRYGGCEAKEVHLKNNVCVRYWVSDERTEILNLLGGNVRGSNQKGE